MIWIFASSHTTILLIFINPNCMNLFSEVSFLVYFLNGGAFFICINWSISLGLLRLRVQDWLLQNHQVTSSGGIQMQLLESLNEFPERFIIHHCLLQNFDDEDLDAWEFEVRRWARVLFLVIKEEHQLAPLMMVCLQFSLYALNLFIYCFILFSLLIGIDFRL